MATLDRVEAFFADPKNIQIVAPSAQIKPIDYAKQYASSKALDRVKAFFAKPDNVRVVVPAAAAGRVNHAQHYAESIGAKITNALTKNASLEKSAGNQAASNPYQAGRKKTAVPAPKTEATNSLVKRKGRSL